MRRSKLRRTKYWTRTNAIDDGSGGTQLQTKIKWNKIIVFCMITKVCVLRFLVEMLCIIWLLFVLMCFHCPRQFTTYAAHIKTSTSTDACTARRTKMRWNQIYYDNVGYQYKYMDKNIPQNEANDGSSRWDNLFGRFGGSCQCN